ncbi:hypothetical protein B0H14DRAFT_3444992 [Mycena olivaceomarginata]|nr:hypothetical protein B0H14DRAFT_3444992 [Mycena olivaceomarginata]
MPNQTTKTPPTTSKHPRKPSKAVSRTTATMAARRQAQARYRQKNLEEEREKARERMARSTASGSHNRKIPVPHFSSARARQAASIVPRTRKPWHIVNASSASSVSPMFWQWISSP